MAPIILESPHSRRRRQHFIATCSPDELLGQVIKTLCPVYNIDAPHILALRQMLSSTIVAPRQPPTLKRTRPDKRIGEIISDHDCPRRSIYDVNGPPMSATQSFYFHHSDPDFERLLPEIDRSRYQRLDEPARQSATGNDEVPDSQESVTSVISNPQDAFMTQRESTTSLTALSDPVDGSNSTPNQQPRETCQVDAAGEVDISSYSTTSLGLQKDPSTIPTITITSPDSKPTSTTRATADATELFPLPHPTDIAIELPNAPATPFNPEPTCLQYTDTQDTVNSTQQSDVFSPPSEFVHFTPPTQEDSQDMSTSQITPSIAPRPDATPAPKATEPRRSLLSPQEPLCPESSLGKRLRTVPDMVDSGQEVKRSKSAA